MTIEALRSTAKAATLLIHPLRPRILAHAREPVSASDLARKLGQPRQRVNYHVRQLANAGLLQLVGQQRKRNMVEQQYVASAGAYVLTPDVLGEAAPQLKDEQDSASAAYLVALCARAQSEVAQVIESANEAGLRVRTTSLQTEVHFENAAQRTRFTRELMEAVNDVVNRYSSPSVTTGDIVENRRPFRLILGWYPVPRD